MTGRRKRQSTCQEAISNDGTKAERAGSSRFWDHWRTTADRAAVPLEQPLPQASLMIDVPLSCFGTAARGLPGCATSTCGICVGCGAFGGAEASGTAAFAGTARAVCVGTQARADLHHPAVGALRLKTLRADGAAPRWVLLCHTVCTDEPLVVCQPPSDTRVIQARTCFDILQANLKDCDNRACGRLRHEVSHQSRDRGPRRANGLKVVIRMQHATPRVARGAEVIVAATEAAVPNTSETTRTATIANDPHVAGAFSSKPPPRADGPLEPAPSAFTA
mmetsp:Transcript_70659/g.163348  ORF Transcript_70659/g.163348 Transcript_70659/m.163348 type:complete len:277 (-) Transcript_70659:347-1177(-)